MFFFFSYLSSTPKCAIFGNFCLYKPFAKFPKLNLRFTRLCFYILMSVQGFFARKVLFLCFSRSQGSFLFALNMLVIWQCWWRFDAMYLLSLREYKGLYIRIFCWRLHVVTLTLGYLRVRKQNTQTIGL